MKTEEPKFSDAKVKKIIAKMIETRDFLASNDVRKLANIKVKADSIYFTFLNKNNIIEKNEDGYIKWNTRIPVSKLLAERYHEHRNEIYSKRDRTVNVTSDQAKSPVRKATVNKINNNKKVNTEQAPSLRKVKILWGLLEFNY